MYHTIPEEGRTSSEVYVRELTAALSALTPTDLDLRHFQPTGRLRHSLAGFAPAARMGGYVDRYLVYQWRARSAPADLHHIVDHGYGHLGFSLDPRRTIANFFDAMLLKFRARELPVDRYPRLTILAHRADLAAIKRAARVIAISRSSRNDLVRFTRVDPGRVRVILLGVSTRFAPCDVEVDVGAVSDVRAASRRILHVGHCGPYKNVEGILRALPRATRLLGEPVQFVKAGGPFTAAQRTLIGTLGIGDHVVHLGPVPDDRLPQIYREADLLVMPSLHEGFGLPVLEAMASGTPVLAANRGSLPEVVGDAGLLVDDPTDPEALAGAIVQGLGDGALRRDLRARGLARAATFTWKRTAQETLEVYREVYEETH